jgi:hypothetical protein
MAVNLSNKIIDEAYKNLYGSFYNVDCKDKKNLRLLNYFLEYRVRIYIYLINILRSFLRKIPRHNISQKTYYIKKTSLSSNTDIVKKEILNKGYVFLENFLDNNFHYFLNKNFPKKFELQKSKSAFKNYNIGNIYLKNEKHLSLEKNSAINILYRFILSPEFENEINNIFNLDSKKLFCKNIVTSIAEKKSFLIPHMDSISLERKDLNVNFIYFVDGNDNQIEYSGGTSIYEDNEAKKILLKPTTLKNSLLIYDNTKNFYHGFKIMKKNCFRKAVTFQFNLSSN